MCCEGRGRGSWKDQRIQGCQFAYVRLNSVREPEPKQRTDNSPQSSHLSRVGVRSVRFVFAVRVSFAKILSRYMVFVNAFVRYENRRANICAPQNLPFVEAREDQRQPARSKGPKRTRLLELQVHGVHAHQLRRPHVRSASSTSAARWWRRKQGRGLRRCERLVLRLVAIRW